jgi:serine/threonine-protein kinase RsbW
MKQRFTQSFSECCFLNITNHYDELVRVAFWLKKLSEQFNISSHTVFKLKLILEEILTNIISYAYSDTGSHVIQIKIDFTDNHVVLEIIDDGMPFNPLAHDNLQDGCSLESAEINGRGIHIIKFFTVEQEYLRADETNLLRLNILEQPEDDSSFASVII